MRFCFESEKILLVNAPCNVLITALQMEIFQIKASHSSNLIIKDLKCGKISPFHKITQKMSDNMDLLNGPKPQFFIAIPSTHIHILTVWHLAKMLPFLIFSGTT